MAKSLQFSSVIGDIHAVIGEIIRLVRMSIFYGGDIIGFWQLDHQLLGPRAIHRPYRTLIAIDGGSRSLLVAGSGDNLQLVGGNDYRIGGSGDGILPCASCNCP